MIQKNAQLVSVIGNSLESSVSTPRSAISSSAARMADIQTFYCWPEQVISQEVRIKYLDQTLKPSSERIKPSQQKTKRPIWLYICHNIWNSCTKTGEFLPPQIEGFFAQGQVGDVREPGGWGFRPQLVKLWFHRPHHCIPGFTSISTKMFIRIGW